jgi:hypothetical protein
MQTLLASSLSALVVLSGLTSSARADLDIRVPFVAVHVGSGGVWVQAPFVRVQAPRPVVIAPAPGPGIAPPVEVAPQPQKIGDPIPVPLPKPGQTDFSVPVPLKSPAEARALTHREFAETFKAAPGTYDVVLLHPVTHRPVAVTFTLPEGQPRRVRTFPRQINIDYVGRRDVTIRFMADGRVRVTN